MTTAGSRARKACGGCGKIGCKILMDACGCGLTVYCYSNYASLCVIAKTPEPRAICSGCSRQHLNAMIAGVAHDDAPIAVNGNATGILELPCAASLAADGANVSPVPVPHHLHTMIPTISYNKVARAIKRNALGGN